MKPKDSGAYAIASEKPTSDKQLYMVVDGCKVKLNFPLQSGDSALNDVKRMMLGGATNP